MSSFMKSMAVLVALAGACGAAADADQEYEVRLHRPDKVGYKYDVATVTAIKSEFSGSGGRRAAADRESIYGVELAATAEILDVDEKGNPTKIAFTIQKLVKRVDGQEDEVLDKGKVVVAEAAENDAVFKLKDGELSEVQRWALRLAIDLESRYGCTAEDYYGTPKRQKSGSSWPLNVQTMVDVSKKRGSELVKDAISGSMKLLGTEPSDGVDCLRLATEMKISKLPPPKGRDLPRGMKLERSTYESSSIMMVPIDVTGRYESESITQTWTRVYKGQVDGKPASIEQTDTRVRNFRAIPLKD
jgi:hypothetical protein